MRLFRTFGISKEAYNSVLAIGNFDGLHLGHQNVISFAKNLAKKKNKPLSVLTFEPHPKCYFKRTFHGFRLTPFKIKFELIRELKVDFYINIFFNNRFSKINANDFINKILIDSLMVNHVITGVDFVFGNNKEGNVEMLKEHSIKTKSFDFSIVDDYKFDFKTRTSSSDIRKFLLNGNLKKAEKLLGRKWSIKSKVIRGKKLGSTIGFPTANLNIDNFCKMKFGVYLVCISFKKDNFRTKFTGIANYGIKPTVNNITPILEVNIFDFKRDIYGEDVKIEFLLFIREEKKFDSLESLKSQIQMDINFCKEKIKSL